MKAKLSELKLEKVRRVLNYEINGEKRIVTIFNPIGKKRSQLLEIFSTANQITDKAGSDNVADMVYKSMLKELVTIDVDVKNAAILDKYPTKVLMDINKEIEEIIFELQYEFLLSQIRKINHTIIASTSGILIEKTKELNALIDKHNELKKREG